MKWLETYYAQESDTVYHVGTARDWTEQLERIEPNLKKRVELAVRQWNTTLRDLLRNETALRLSVGEEVTQVPLKVHDGLPDPLLRFLRRYERIATLLLHRHDIEHARVGLDALKDYYPKWLDFCPYGAVPPDQVGALRDWLGLIANHLEGEQIERGLSEINEDCLGAYFFRSRRIEIYWEAIGIYARLTGASIEGLTVVTLAHELAHAYTHLGKDIDGVVWETEAFAHTELEVVEGLAQYYTRAICQKLENRFPAALAAFDALLKTQSPVYTDFLNWVPGHPHQGEVVRFAMINGRSNAVMDYHRFRAEMENLRV